MDATIHYPFEDLFNITALIALRGRKTPVFERPAFFFHNFSPIIDFIHIPSTRFMSIKIQFLISKLGSRLFPI